MNKKTIYGIILVVAILVIGWYLIDSGTIALSSVTDDESRFVGVWKNNNDPSYEITFYSSGSYKSTRTGTGTWQLVGGQLETNVGHVITAYDYDFFDSDKSLRLYNTLSDYETFTCNC